MISTNSYIVSPYSAVKYICFVFSHIEILISLFPCSRNMIALLHKTSFWLVHIFDLSALQWETREEITLEK